MKIIVNVRADLPLQITDSGYLAVGCKPHGLTALTPGTTCNHVRQFYGMTGKQTNLPVNSITTTTTTF